MKIKENQIYKLAFIISVFNIFLLLVDFGFENSPYLQKAINAFYVVVLAIGFFSILTRYLIRKNEHIKTKVIILDVLILIVVIVILYSHFSSDELRRHIDFLYDDNWIILGVILMCFREFADHKINFSATVITPAQLFIISFLVIIIVGAFLLMLPKATYQSISFIDALFTSTSAVCVTGLIVLDTGSAFTPLGQIIILVLIQTGGLGILTVASYFSHFFKGDSTYKNQLVLSDITNTGKIGEVFSTLKYVILITLSIEIISTILIFFSIPTNVYDIPDKIFFSIFHSVSAFCNAGFSTLSYSLFDSGFCYNYNLQLVLISTFVFGGLGFPIVVNILKYLKYQIFRIIPIFPERIGHKPWIVNFNSRITLTTTFALTLIATLVLLILEYNNAFSGHSLGGKIVTSLFTATTPRTAGFNSVDMNSLNISTIMFILLLMWIGASPASTGGGIKTNTFAIAVLNIISFARGRDSIEIFNRRISPSSISRAFAIIALSLFVIGFGVILISVFEKDKKLLDIVFECFSAYSTVGLSLGITAELSDASRLVLVVIMFIGRVSMLTIIIALFRKAKHKNYKYPTEEILIN